jgi:hypothetical protein
MARRENFSVGQLTVSKIYNQYGQNITPGANPSGAMDYYVDLNTANGTADGLSWDTAFDTVAEAITASNASIGLSANRWWARRNRIFVCGDGIKESLTVLPEKCDIIGVGADLHPFPRITGAHTIAVAKVGCRFINMGFQASGTGDLFVIPAGCHGLEYLGCHFQAAAAGNTKCLEITDSAIVKVIGCRILQSPAAYGTGIFGIGISIEGTSATHETVIEDNFIDATVGVKVVASSPSYGSVINNNIIKSTSYWVDDDSDTVMVVNNRACTAINCATSTAGYDFNLDLASGNLQTEANASLCDTVPFTLIAEG